MTIWVAPGCPKNWEIALSWDPENNRGIWGLKEKYKKLWNEIEEGDVVLFYVTQPVKGVVGYGSTEEKFKSREPIWEDCENEGGDKNKGVFPLRFTFSIECALPRKYWEEMKVTHERLMPVSFGRRREEIAVEIIEELEERCRVLYESLELRQSSVAMSSGTTSVVKCDDVKKWLRELGKMYGLIVEEGRPLESSQKNKVDVVWKRSEIGAPSHAFEIEKCSGDVKHSLEILATARGLWNSMLYFVANDPDKAYKILADTTTLKNIKNVIKIITVNDVAKLYDLKSECIKLEKELGFPVDIG